MPEVLHTLAEATLRRRVLANLNAERPSFSALRQHIAEAAEVKVSLDTPEIALAASEGLRRLIDRVAGSEPRASSIPTRSTRSRARPRSRRG